MTSRVRVNVSMLGPFALAPLLAGCTPTPTIPLGPTPGLTAYNSATAGLVEHHRFHHHGGITLLIAMSLDTLELTAEQQPAVERARAALRATMTASRLSDQGLLETLADGVIGGHVNPTDVDAEIPKVGAASASVFGASVPALNELRAALTPAQRKALFEKVAWHWAIWQNANGERSDDPGDIHTMVTNLGLTTDQTERFTADIRSALGRLTRLDPTEVSASIRVLGQEFETRDFDDSAITVASLADKHMSTWGAARLASIVEAAVPILDEKQRAILGHELRDHAHDTAMSAARR
jgi:Spy/CpxP family protein refolding chaperone